VTHPFRSIIDVLLFAAMGPPGGGRTFITPRMTGCMFLVGFPLLDDDNMVKIFQTILEWKFQADGYPEDVQSLTKKIVVGTLEMYKAAVAALLPTPRKVHYTFNLRDFAKVIFGILLMRQKECDGSQKHLRLWVHEVTRVIGDRLVDNSDRLWMLEHMRNVMKTNFNASFDDVMKHLDSDCDGKVNTLDEVVTYSAAISAGERASGTGRPYLLRRMQRHAIVLDMATYSAASSTYESDSSASRPYICCGRCSAMPPSRRQRHMLTKRIER